MNLGLFLENKEITDMEAKDIKTLEQAERFVEGCLNDLIEGIATKGETMKQLAEYTGRIIGLTSKLIKKL